jgi:hypothetical protein
MAKIINIEDVVDKLSKKKGDAANVRAHGKHLAADNQEDLMNDAFTPAAQAAYDAALDQLGGRRNDDKIGVKEADIYTVLNTYMETFIRKTRPKALTVYDNELKNMKPKERHDFLAHVFEKIAGKEASLAGYAASVGRRGGIKVRSLKSTLRKHKDGSAEGGLSQLNEASYNAHISDLSPGVYARHLTEEMKAEYEVPEKAKTAVFMTPPEALHKTHAKYAGKALTQAEAEGMGYKKKPKKAA